MAYLKQLRCPSCGANLELNSPQDLIVECPHCHQQVVNDSVCLSQDSGMPPRILTFRLKEDDVMQAMVNSIAEDQSVPTDIFDKMNIISINKYYVPMYIFEGTFRAPWTAERSRQEKRQRIGRDGKIEDYEETLYDYFNGEAAGNFSVNGIPSHEMSYLELNSESIQKIIVNPSNLSLFQVQLNSNKNIKIITPSSESGSVWWESGEPTAQEIGISTACCQAPGRVTSCSASCELKKTSLVYIPLWKIQYEYSGDMFNAIYYAEQFIDYNHPIGKKIEAQPTVEQEYVLEKYSKRDNVLSKIRDLGCAGFAAVGLIGCVYLHQTLEKLHYYDPYYREHSDDDFNFLKYMFFAGIALLVLIPVIKYLFRRKDRIDDIEEDIANRTRVLQNDADNYRRKTGEIFLKQFSGYSSGMSSIAQEMSSFINDAKIEGDPDNRNISTLHVVPQKTRKFCSHCGKEINDAHKFCRYCGAKL